LVALAGYVAEHGDARVRHDYVTPDGLELGKWITKQQAAYKANRLTHERIAALETAPGWSWGRHQTRFDEGLSALRRYVDVHHDACVPQSYVTADGFALGTWVHGRRQEYKKGLLADERTVQLESLPGWRWTVQRETRAAGFDDGMTALHTYIAEHGHSRVPASHVAADGFKLGAWVSRRRSEHKRGALTATSVQQLEAFPGWAWNARPQRE
jgi:hypothetical protein